MTAEAFALDALLSGESMPREAATEFMRAVLAEAIAPEVIAAALAAMRVRGETADEILGFHEALMASAVLLPVSMPRLIDTCGTGGDGLGTFNISTAVAPVVACCGVPVAKHGNRSVSSRSGSADVLEAAGVPISGDIDRLARTLEDLGLAFLFAPYHHPALKVVAPLRRSLGVMTAFNLLGPMANPAPLTHQLVGVPRLSFARQYGDIYAKRDIIATIVHGRDGADEALPGGPYFAVRVRGGRYSEGVEQASDAGCDDFALEAFRGEGPEQNAELLLELLSGRGPVALQQAIALNAGLALHTAGAVASVAEGYATALHMLGTGEPAKLLREYAARMSA